MTDTPKKTAPRRLAPRHAAKSAPKRVAKPTANATPLTERISDQANKAGAVYSEARDRTVKAATRANAMIQDNPLIAASAAAATGALIAMLFPRGRALIKAVPAALVAIGNKATEAAGVAGGAISTGAENAYAKASDVAGDVKTAVSDADLRGRATDLAAAASALAHDAAHAISSGLDTVKASVSKAGTAVEESDVAAKTGEFADAATALVKEAVDAVSRAASKLRK